jgi:hypothetical protein
MPAYEENSVPDQDDITYPYLTYQAVGALPVTNNFINVSIWTRSISLVQLTTLAEKVLSRFQNNKAWVRFNGGGFWLTAEDNFIQIMGDDSDNAIKRAVLSLVIHW